MASTERSYILKRAVLEAVGLLNLGDSYHYLKNRPAPMPPTVLPEKCWLYNFHAVFGHSTKNVYPQLDPLWEALVCMTFQWTPDVKGFKASNLISLWCLKYFTVLILNGIKLLSSWWELLRCFTIFWIFDYSSWL